MIMHIDLRHTGRVARGSGNPAHGCVAGALLVAAPPLDDPNFDRTVIFIIEHSAAGALGLVINRPAAEPLLHTLPDPLRAWIDLLGPEPHLYHGGPVQPEAIIGLGRQPDGIVTPVDLSGDPASHDVDRVRLFRGYSGWSPGQLDGELREAAWVVCDAQPADVFTDAPHDLWRGVLRRQSGSTAWLANSPDDLSMN